ncbi:hypothetical protein Q5P01_015254 [Channa striata]|uniref:Uncharacterized protein n=1 Tax=Channa striata TaxID=64152 RepID=A0AA88SIN6_CHASR|nr:hypothetical protein Q5P01_015254 [Channa striata]
MAKFLAELLGCAVPDKGAASLFECRSQPPLGLRPPSRQQPTIFGPLTNERAAFDNRLEEAQSEWDMLLFHPQI